MLGAGNVATHLAMELNDKGFNISQIYSRTEESAKKLAQKVDAGFCTNTHAIIQSADLYLISLSDDAVERVLSGFDAGDAIIAHTSGTLPLEILAKSSRHYGVIYPVQTFSMNKELDFEDVPICVEANEPATLEALVWLASCMSQDVRRISTETRRMIHLAAVFACNFQNYLFVAAADILEHNQTSFDILLPLIRESVEKAALLNPWQAQTGPAMRQDNQVIEKHLILLEKFPEYKEIYRLISNAISSRKKNNSELNL